MHEEWLDARREATTEVQLTSAPEVSVTKWTGYGAELTTVYRPFRIEVTSSWPGTKIGHGATSVHIHANEVYWDGAVSQLRVVLLLSDLDEIHQWLKDLVIAAEARNFG